MADERSTVAMIEDIWRELDAFRGERAALRAERKEIARILRAYVDAPLSIPHVQALQNLSARLNPETYVRDLDARD